MSMFETEVIEAKSPYKDLQLSAQSNGFSFAFFYDNKKTANSQEHGEFEILQGLQLDLSLSTQTEIIEKSELASFIPNTMLRNLMANGGLIRGEAYIVTKKWSKGDLIPGRGPKDKAKGHGFVVSRVKAPDTFLSSLKEKHDTLVPNGLSVEDAPKVTL